MPLGGEALTWVAEVHQRAEQWFGRVTKLALYRRLAKLKPKVTTTTFYSMYSSFEIVYRVSWGKPPVRQEPRSSVQLL